jgi:hypothetical protein
MTIPSPGRGRGAPGHPTRATAGSGRRSSVRRHPPGRLTLGALALLLGWSVALPSGVARAEAASGAEITGAPGLSGPAAGWTFDLYDAGDFVSQTTIKRCVAGAMQIMVNVMSAGSDGSTGLQDRLAALAHRLRGAREHGIGPEGWANALTTLGYGRYAVRAYRTRDAALAAAVLAVRRTERPAGLMVWRGAHSWVLHGFEATGDPLLDPNARVTAFRISDPWYPRVSTIWGASDPPDSAYSAADLREDYLPWRRPDGRYPGWDGRFLVVEPIAPTSHSWRLA